LILQVSADYDFNRKSAAFQSFDRCRIVQVFDYYNNFLSGVRTHVTQRFKALSLTNLRASTLKIHYVLNCIEEKEM
jgi:hypothetical protein